MSENNNTLKEQALLQSIGENAYRYEEKIADLKVELTKCINQYEEVATENRRLQSEVESLKIELETIRREEFHEEEVSPTDDSH